MSYSPTEWRPTAAYLYVLKLDSGTLAWEYLRRNVEYRADCKRSPTAKRASFQTRWGLQFRSRSHTRWARRASNLDMR